MLKNSTETGRDEQGMTLRRKLLQGVLVLVLVLFMLVAVAPREASAFGTSSYGGYWGGSTTCSTCTLKNHNETLVEDEE